MTVRSRKKLPSVLLLHNVPGAAAFSAACAESDADVLAQVNCVAAALAKLGVRHRVVGVRRLAEVASLLAEAKESVVFNLVECLAAHDQAASVPALCDAFGKGCTGGDTPCLDLTLHKWRTKAVLRAAGLPVLDDVLVPVGTMPADGDLPTGTLIVKPVATDGSEGLHIVQSSAGHAAQMKKAIKYIHQHFNQAAMIEQYYGSREIMVPILQDGRDLAVLAIAETDFGAFPRDRPRIVDYKAKWFADSFEFRNTTSTIPARLDAGLRARVSQAAIAAWHACGCRDYARVDTRCDAHGNFIILEINSNPDIADDGGYTVSCIKSGIAFDHFVEMLITNAAARLRASHTA